MKTKKIKKLALAKQTIVNLRNSELSGIRGGYFTGNAQTCEEHTCPPPPPPTQESICPDQCGTTDQGTGGGNLWTYISGCE